MIRVTPSTILATIAQPGDDATARPGITHRSSRFAFPRHCEYACALEIHRAKLSVDDWVGLGSACCLGLAAAGFWLAPLVR